MSVKYDLMEQGATQDAKHPIHGEGYVVSNLFSGKDGLVWMQFISPGKIDELVKFDDLEIFAYPEEETYGEVNPLKEYTILDFSFDKSEYADHIEEMLYASRKGFKLVVFGDNTMGDYFYLCKDEDYNEIEEILEDSYIDLDDPRVIERYNVIGEPFNLQFRAMHVDGFIINLIHNPSIGEIDRL